MCVFCKIINNEFSSYKVYEDNDILAILDISQATIGHTLVIPKKHIENIFDCDNETFIKMNNVVKQLCDKYKKVFNISNLNILNNSGSIAGQVVNHFHIHIIPRYESDNMTNPIFVNNSSEINFEELLNKINQA